MNNPGPQSFSRHDSSELEADEPLTGPDDADSGFSRHDSSELEAGCSWSQELQRVTSFSRHDSSELEAEQGDCEHPMLPQASVVMIPASLRREFRTFSFASRFCFSRHDSSELEAASGRHNGRTPKKASVVMIPASLRRSGFLGQSSVAGWLQSS